MKKITLLLLMLLLLFSVTACNAGSSTDSATDEANFDSVSSYDNTQSSEGIAEQEISSASVGGAVYSDSDAKVIRTAELTIQTTDFNQTTTNLAALTEEQGGYYESAQVDGGGYYDQYANRTASYVIRIPKENFEAFRDSVSEVEHLYSIQENTEDVGEIYYDTEARLTTLETERDRLLALLEKADVMEDIISLESALADVQYEIDTHNTTLRKYDSLIDYATFKIYVEEVVEISQEPTLGDSFLAKLGASFRDGMDDFVNGLQNLSFWAARNIIALVILAAFFTAAVKIFLIYRKKRRAARAEKE